MCYRYRGRDADRDLECRFAAPTPAAETKLLDAAFPVAEIEAAGYRVAFNGQKTYHGVALLARSPLSETVIEIPSFDDAQALRVCRIDRIARSAERASDHALVIASFDI